MFLPVRGWQTRQYQRLKLGTQKNLPPAGSKGSISLHFVTVTGTRKHPKWNLLRYLVKLIEAHIFVDFNPCPFYHYTWSFRCHFSRQSNWGQAGTASVASASVSRKLG